MIHSTRKVRKRDGREVPFDQSKIADAIYRAAQSVGGGDALLAEELASVVALFIDKEWVDRTPSIDDISDLIEKVLVETGHARTAKAFILERDRRARIRSALRVRHDEGGGPREALPKVDARVHATVSPWSKGKIVEALMVEGDVEATMAEEIAAAVERRVFAAGLTRVSTTLIRALVDNELFERGYERVLNRQVMIGLPRYDLDRMARSGASDDADDGGGPVAIDRVVARSSWTHYSLLEIYPVEVVEAHLSGRIHLGALGSPTRYQGVELDLAHVFRSPPRVGESVLERLRMLHRRCALLADETVRVRGLERQLAARIRTDDLDTLAREVMIALSVPVDVPVSEPRLELEIGLRLRTDVLAAWIDAGVAEVDALARHRAFLGALLRAVSAVGMHHRVPRLCLDVSRAGDEDIEVLELAALAEGGPGRAVMIAYPGLSGTLSSYSPIHLHVDIDVAQAAFRAPRFDTRAVVAQLDAAIELAAAACEARAVFLHSLPGQASPRERLRALANNDAGAIGFGRYEIGFSGLDAACRIAFDHGILRDPRAREFATALIESAGLAVKRQAEQRRLPLALAYTDDPVVLARFGRMDFERHPRGRDVHGVAHDGRKYLYTSTVAAFEQEPDPAELAELEATLRRGFVPTPLPVHHSLAPGRARFARLLADHLKGDLTSC